MSYYVGNYYQNPRPYDSPDTDEPVPGWGLDPQSYNQKMVGVGAVALVKASTATPIMAVKKDPITTMRAYVASQPIEVSSIPWYYWIGGSALAVGLAGFAYYKFG